MTEEPDDPLPPSTAYRLVHGELMLDGNSRLSLAAFVTTWREPQAGVLMGECRDKNTIDKDEYPRTAELERRCVAMLAELLDDLRGLLPDLRAQQHPLHRDLGRGPRSTTDGPRRCSAAEPCEPPDRQGEEHREQRHRPEHREQFGVFGCPGS